MATGD